MSLVTFTLHGSHKGQLSTPTTPLVVCEKEIFELIKLFVEKPTARPTRGKQSTCFVNKQGEKKKDQQCNMNEITEQTNQ